MDLDDIVDAWIDHAITQHEVPPPNQSYTRLLGILKMVYYYEVLEMDRLFTVVS